MATFPNYAKIVWPDTSEQHASAVLRSEVERGIPRTRRNAADTLVSVSVTLQLFTPQRVADFESWFYAEAMAGAAWFSFTHPRTGAVVQGRMVSGFGPVRQMGNQTWSLPAVIEYIRPGFVQLPPGLHSVNPARVLSVQRNSTATYVDDAGLLQTAAANVARYQGGQLLVEDAATNHLLHSQALNNAAWAGCTVSAAAEVYRGAAPFWAIAKATAVTSESRGQNAKSVVAGEAGTVTVALLAGTSSQCSVGILHNNPTGWGLDAESTASVLEGPGAIAARGGSLCTVTGLSATVPTLLRITRTFADVGTSTLRIYPDVHTSSTMGASVKATRAQYLGSATDSSYIPTTTATATRAADIITVAA